MKGTTILYAILLFICYVPQNHAQVRKQECIKQLQPCSNYLNNSKNPSERCCKSLDYVIESIPECLCSLISIEGASQAKQAGLNVTQAQTLPGRCGQHINPLGCVTGTPDTRSKNSVPNAATSFKLAYIAHVTTIVATFLILRAF